MGNGAASSQWIAGVQSAEMALYAGFTTMVDQGSRDNLPWATIEMRNAIMDGRLLGPRMQVTGPVVNPRGGTAGLPSDPDAVFDREETIDISAVEPQVTWGVNSEHVVGVSERVPDPDNAPAGNRENYRAALDYTGLTPGDPIAGTPIDEVFIGSCTESRIDDLRAAAEVVDGRQVAPNVIAWVIAGAMPIKRQAEAEGLDRIFTEAGFEWREPGCSKCIGMNGEHVAPGNHAVSNSNRNFIGRQGRDSITHIASTPMAAAVAIAGRIVDVRRLMQGEPPHKSRLPCTNSGV